MRPDRKPRTVKAKITRTVTEIAIVLLDHDGHVEEIDNINEELDTDDIEVITIIDVITVQ